MQLCTCDLVCLLFLFPPNFSIINTILPSLVLTPIKEATTFRCNSNAYSKQNLSTEVSTPFELFTFAADVLEGGKVVKNLVPLHVRPHLGKHCRFVVMHARKGGDAQILDEHKRRFVPTTVTQAGFKQSTGGRLLNTRQLFVFGFSSLSWLVQRGDK